MTNYDEGTLPPLPASDPKTLEWNKKDYYYDVKAREFWGKAKLIREELSDFPKCDHYFIPKDRGVECTKCHIGFIGVFEINKGKLFYKGEPLKI